MSFTYRILGCGSSGGVPRIAAGWGACDPQNPKNRRQRCSMLITRRNVASGGLTRVLIDTSPDMRMQLIDADVSHLDGVVFTHEHADHVHGLDDLRAIALYNRKRVDVYADSDTSLMLHQRFKYCFETPQGSDYPPILREHRIIAGKEFTIDGAGGSITLLPFSVNHGAINALGFRIGGLAYLPDVKIIPESALSALQGLDYWVLDALRYTPHNSHFSVSDALHWIEKQKPKQAVLTNLHVDLDYDVLKAELPSNIVPAYDGMEIVI